MPSSNCIKCKPYISSLLGDINKHQSTITQLKEDINQLNKKLKYYESDNIYADISSDNTSRHNLRMDSFKSYLSSWIIKIPLLGYILGLFLSTSHKRKLKATNSPPHWKKWSYFYQSFIVEVFLRAHSPKTVHRTTLLLSAYMLLGNMSNSCWNLLQKMKILVSKKYLEQWITSHVKKLKSRDSFLIYVFDNCDIKLHVTHVRREHRTKMLHLLTR